MRPTKKQKTTKKKKTKKTNKTKLKATTYNSKLLANPNSSGATTFIIPGLFCCRAALKIQETFDPFEFKFSFINLTTQQTQTP
jgi:hypothetical protein